MHVTESGSGTEATDDRAAAVAVGTPAPVDPVDHGAVDPAAGGRGGTATAGGPEDRTSGLEREGDVAADFLEELLDIADLDGDIDLDVDGERAVVSLVGGDLGHLVGVDGAVVMALQDLTRLAVTRETGERTRLVLDVDGYRDRRTAEITALATEAVELVRGGAQRSPLPPMSPFERKIAHDVVASLGLSSDSEGEDPGRRVVVSAP